MKNKYVARKKNKRTNNKTKVNHDQPRILINRSRLI